MPSLEESTSLKMLPDQVEIGRIAELSEQLEATWLPDFPLHLEKLELRYEPKVYLFLAAFPQLRPCDVAELSLALRFVLYSTLLTDKLIDHTEGTDDLARNALRVQAIQFESYRLLYSLFPPTSQFWQRYKSYLSRFNQACLDEQCFADGQYRWEQFDEDRALSIIRGKNSLALLLAASLAELADDDSDLHRLTEAIEKHYIAWQFWDDLCDWKEDFRAGVPSLLLSRVLSELPPPNDREKWIPILARKIYYEGHAREMLERALRLLDSADRAVADIPELGWRQVIADLRLKCVRPAGRSQSDRAEEPSASARPASVPARH